MGLPKGSQEQWQSPDWCDDHIRPEGLSDGDVLAALEKVSPYAGVLVTLLGQVQDRALRAALEPVRDLLTHPDPFVATAAASALGVIGANEDAETLVRLLPAAADPFHAAALLEAAIRMDPSKAPIGIDCAGKSGDGYLAAVVAKALPDNLPDVADLLLRWASDPSLGAGHPAIFRRLAGLPRTAAIEDFFVQYLVDDDGRHPELTAIADDALTQ